MKDVVGHLKTPEQVALKLQGSNFTKVMNSNSLVEINLLIAQVDDASLEVGQMTLWAVSNILYENKATVATIMPPYVLVTFGTPYDRAPDDSNRMETAATRLNAEVGILAKAVFGTVTGIHRLIELPFISIFSPMCGSGSEMFSCLQDLKLGTYERITLLLKRRS